MPDPLFDSRTARHDLPLLFAGQAQKEVFVNELAARLDALLHPVIESETATPPADPADGQCWLVGSSPTGAWAGQQGRLAARQGGQWLFFDPVDGMRAFSRSAGKDLRWSGQWQGAVRPALPSGGTTVDSEARAAISAIVAALTAAGIVPPA